MNFDDTPEEARFRREVRAWLDAHAKRKTESKNLQPHVETEAIAHERAWLATKSQARYSAITWPERFGGRGGSLIQSVIFDQEEDAYAVPKPYFFGINLYMAMPTLIAHASAALLETYVRPALTGEHLWCQLFSEPSGGSDLAALRTRARRDDNGDWIVNGRKVWTSYAQHADYGILLARTDSTRPKHAGLTFFIIDMRQSGVVAQPIKLAAGSSHFNEVTFTDARIPDDHRVGAINEGWRVALTTLMNERAGLGGGLKGVIGVADVLALAQQRKFCGAEALEDGRVRERIADWWLNERGLILNNYRALTALSRGVTPGGEFSIGKLVAAKQLQEIANFIIDLNGGDGVIAPAEGSSIDAHHAFFWGSALRIAAGTDEIMRNVIGERVLGLPGEPRVDRDIPFEQLPGGIIRE